MACPAILSGQSFLASAIAYVDCQSQTIGSYGYGALSDPTSPVSLALAGLLTILVALFGLRLLLGYWVGRHDLAGDLLRVGIVLTIATSWPAWRVLGYNVVINGPGEVVQSLAGGSGLPGPGELSARMQVIDQGLAALNTIGSGRLGAAVGDWLQLGLARNIFLAGALAPLALVRLSAGILLALAPLMAGLLLFGFSRSIFVGWAKGLVATFIGSVALALVQAVQLGLMEPWLQDALSRRQAGDQILDAPVEVLVMTLAFTFVSIGSLALAARIAFHPGGNALLSVATGSPAAERPTALAPRQVLARPESDSPARAQAVAYAVSETLRREVRDRELHRLAALTVDGQGIRDGNQAATGRSLAPEDALGGSYRRTSRRVSAAQLRRDLNA